VYKRQGFMWREFLNWKKPKWVCAETC